MPTQTDLHRAALRSLNGDWDDYILQHCNLPGPRGNLELAHAVAWEGQPAMFERWLGWTVERAPVNDPHEFLYFCAVLGLGVHCAGKDPAMLERLAAFSQDARWRTREAVAMALQAWGDRDMPALLTAMRSWVDAGRYQQRAAVAGLCEPRLLKDPTAALETLKIMDDITATLENAPDRASEPFRTLRQALGYAWSVAVVALPAEGKPRMERWMASTDADICWVIHENLKKNRLVRMDAAWVDACKARYGL